MEVSGYPWISPYDAASTGAKPRVRATTTTLGKENIVVRSVGMVGELLGLKIGETS